MGCACKQDLLAGLKNMFKIDASKNRQHPSLCQPKGMPCLEVDKWEFTCKDLATNSITGQKRKQMEANEADYNSRHQSHSWRLKSR